MIHGACHCGAVAWQFDGLPKAATACNCTVCRRYGVLWAYDYLEEGIRTSGDTRTYSPGEWLEFHFCPTCACVAFWCAQRADENGRRRAAVNLRLSEPDAVTSIPIRHFDGLHSFKDLPSEGKCVADYWP